MISSDKMITLRKPTTNIMLNGENLKHFSNFRNKTVILTIIVSIKYSERNNP